MDRRTAMTTIGSLAVGGLPPFALAQEAYPSRTIRWIVPFPPGGGVDITSRIVAQRLSERLHQPVVVDNRDGGGGLVGTRVAAQGKPDGYTVVTQSFNILTFHSLVKNRGFDVYKDFTPVSLLTFYPLVLAVPYDSPAKTLDDFIQMAKSKKEGVTFGASSLGGGGHVAAAMFQKAVAPQTRIIPYKGGAAVAFDLVGGRLDASFAHIASVMEFMKANKVRALAISAPTRSPLQPALPTMIESGHAGFDVGEFVALFAAGNPPEAAVNRLYTESKAILAEPEVKTRLEALGAIIVASTPAEHAKYNAEKSAEYGKLLAELGMQPV